MPQSKGFYNYIICILGVGHIPQFFPLTSLPNFTIVCQNSRNILLHEFILNISPRNLSQYVLSGETTSSLEYLHGIKMFTHNQVLPFPSVANRSIINKRKNSTVQTIFKQINIYTFHNLCISQTGCSHSSLQVFQIHYKTCIPN